MQVFNVVQVAVIIILSFAVHDKIITLRDKSSNYRALNGFFLCLYLVGLIQSTISLMIKLTNVAS